MKKKNRLKLSFFLNLFFTVAEIIGSVLTNSIALLSDAIHDFGDSISIGLSMFFEKRAQKKPDSDYTYGYRRYSLLGGMIASIVLLVGSTIVIVQAVPRLFEPEEVRAGLLIYFAIGGVLVNGAAALNAARGSSLNEKVISLHLFEDVLGWVALLIASIIMNIWPVYWLDAALSIGFTLYILSHVWTNMKEITAIFLERAPGDPSLGEIKEALSDINHVKNIHHVHYWRLEENIPLLTLHVTVDGEISKESFIVMQHKIHEVLNEMGIEHVTAEPEFEGDECMMPPCEDFIDDASSNDKGHHHH